MDNQQHPTDIPRRSPMSSIAIQSHRTGAVSSRRPSPRRVTPAAAVRLTRRGRATVLLTMVAVLLVAVTVLGSQSAATDHAGAPVPTRTVVVHQGDTLWGIASQVAAPGQVRETIHRIEELNALSGPALSVGQEIAVPAR
jgi:LysM repeat protein